MNTTLLVMFATNSWSAVDPEPVEPLTARKELIELNARRVYPRRNAALEGARQEAGDVSPAPTPV